jgi:hypothetical protein
MGAGDARALKNPSENDFRATLGVLLNLIYQRRRDGRLGKAAAGTRAYACTACRLPRSPRLTARPICRICLSSPNGLANACVGSTAASTAG